MNYPLPVSDVEMITEASEHLSFIGKVNPEIEQLKDCCEEVSREFKAQFQRNYQMLKALGVRITTPSLTVASISLPSIRLTSPKYYIEQVQKDENKRAGRGAAIGAAVGFMFLGPLGAMAGAALGGITGASSGQDLVLVTGDFLTGGIGLAMGFKAMLKTMMLQFVAGIILVLFNVLNPVAIVATAIAAILAGGGWNMMSLKGEIKKNVSKKLREELTNRNQDLALTVEVKVRDKLLELKDALDKNLAAEISSIRDEVEQILSERKRGKLDADKEIQSLRALEEENRELDKHLINLMFEAGLIN